MDVVAPLQRMKSTRLGKAKWTDPERRQSIKDDTRVKMEWRFRTPLHIMKCWVALLPARPCLLEAMERVEGFLQERNHEVWEGENTSPGCSYDVAMHGRSVNDAQPAVIFCSPSKICRRNAENIIANEDIAVDPRGIGMEYYSTGPDFVASSNADIELGMLGMGEEGSGKSTGLLSNLHSSRRSFKSSSSSHRSTPSQNGTSRQLPRAYTVNGNLIYIESRSCTLGGLISIDGELYGLTVAHAFERDGISNSLNDSRPTPTPIIHQPNAGRIGSLLEKRYVANVSSESQRDLDWALCSLDRAKVHLTDNIRLPDGTTIYPTQIALQNPSDADVWVHTGTTGLVKGFLTGAYSLVALPGSRTFQRMWIVVLDRLIRPGDCGSWVIDSTNGIWYGHIIAAKPETAVAYIVLARDIFRDIRDQFGGRNVRMPIESDFISETVSVVKRELSRSNSSAQVSSQQGFTPFSISSKGQIGDVLSNRSKVSPVRRILLKGRWRGNSTLGQDNPGASIEVQSLAHIAARESFQQTIFQTSSGNDADGYGQGWYLRYLESCFREHFKFYLLPTLPGLNQATLGSSSIGGKNMEIVYRFLAALAQHLQGYKRETTICGIVDDLQNSNSACDFLETDDSRMNINGLLLTAIGWLTMSMPHPNLHSNDSSKYEGRGVFVNQQGLEDSCDQPLSMLLRKFNLFAFMLDPPPVYKAYGQTHTSQYFMISTICFNTLRKIADIQILWTEQLPLHLEFDRKRRTLTLFAFPSFARMQCVGSSNTILAQILQDFYSLYSYPDATKPPNNASVEDLCREILLSYRLIFGLNSSSCRLFNSECANEMRLSSDFDPLLSVLCGQKWDSASSKPIFEEIGADPPASFYLTSDFPLFGHKLFELHDFVQGQYPSSFQALWNDKRDTTRWFIFWAVVFVGGLTILFAFLQTVFQIWQVVLTQQQLNQAGLGSG